MEVLRDGRLETVVFPRPTAVRVAANTTAVKEAVEDFKHSPNINRDSLSAKLRDFLTESEGVLNVFLCEEQLHNLKANSGKGACPSTLAVE